VAALWVKGPSVIYDLPQDRAFHASFSLFSVDRQLLASAWRLSTRGLKPATETVGVIVLSLR
jgi:hypothetical protein